MLVSYTRADWTIQGLCEDGPDKPLLVLDSSGLLSASPLVGPLNSCALSNRAAGLINFSVCIDDLLPIDWSDQPQILSFDSSSIKYSDLWIDDSGLAGSTNVGLWASGSDFAQISDWRHVVGQAMIQFFPRVSCRELTRSTDWESQLATVASVDVLSQRLPSVPASFAFVYQAGQLLFASSIRCFTWLFDRLNYYAQMLRCAAAFVVAFLRFGKGLADVVGVFLNERSWYLHHSAHPPAAVGKAGGGRFPAMLRACFRPLPS